MGSLAVHIVTWNGSLVIERLLKSLECQSLTNFKIRFLDNNSSDTTFSILSNWSSVQDTDLTRTNINLGFSGGHNILFNKSSEDYVLLLNQDVELKQNYLELLVNELDSNPALGSTSGVLYRFNNNEIDSAGLKIKRNHSVSDIKTVLTKPRYNVFGVSGAAAMYRKKALSDVSFETNGQPEIFSNKFHTYKEDVDLAYRLQLANWGSSIITSAVGYHERGLKNQGLSSRFRQNKLLRFMSFRNHMLFLTHTAQFTWMSITGINVLAYEAFKIVWIVFFETQSLKALKEVITLRSDSKQKREQVKRMIKNPEAIIKWLS